MKTSKDFLAICMEREEPVRKMIQILAKEHASGVPEEQISDGLSQFLFFGTNASSISTEQRKAETAKLSGPVVTSICSLVCMIMVEVKRESDRITISKAVEAE